jgi:sarcosine/dimethylglycine N-methyltransferase
VPVPSRETYVQALERAKLAAFRPGQYVGQESFMEADEIVDLARSASVDRSTGLLDLCCGVAGPGLHIASQTGCSLTGVDRDPGAIDTARQRAREAGLSAEFLVSTVPPKLARRYDAVMIMETLLAFRDKRTLLTSVRGLLRADGTFFMTLEEGCPLTEQEAADMPYSDTVWLISLEEMLSLLQETGFHIESVSDHTERHQKVAESLFLQYRGLSEEIARQVGEKTCRNLVRSTQLWSDWLSKKRVRKFALVATRKESNDENR